MGLENGAYAPFSVCKVYFIEFMVMIRIAIGNTSTRFDLIRTSYEDCPIARSSLY